MDAWISGYGHQWRQFQEEFPVIVAWLQRWIVLWFGGKQSKPKVERFQHISTTGLRTGFFRMRVWWRSGILMDFDGIVFWKLAARPPLDHQLPCHLLLFSSLGWGQCVLPGNCAARKTEESEVSFRCSVLKTLRNGAQWRLWICFDSSNPDMDCKTFSFTWRVVIDRF